MLRATRVVGPLLLYGAVVCWLTWPLAASVTTHLPFTHVAGAFDPLYTAWVLAWETHALGSAGVTMLGANIYHPAPDALVYGPPALGAVPYFGTVFASTGNPALALNLLFLGSVVLTATLVHAVVRRWTGVAAAGLVAACTILTSRWLLWDLAPTAPQFAVVFYLPLIVDRAARPLRDHRGMLVLLLLVLAQGLVDLVYLAPATMLPLLVLAGARLARQQTRAEGLRMLAVLALAGLVLVAIHWPWLALVRREPDLPMQTLWRLAGTFPLSLPWGVLGWLSPLAVPTVTLAVIALGAAKALHRRWHGARAPHDRLWKHAALWAIVGTAISLPPQGRWGDTVVKLPLAFVRSYVPSLSFIRQPQRLGVVGLIGLALLAGVAFAELAAGLATAARSARARLLCSTLAIALALAMYVQYARCIGEPAVYGFPLSPTYPLRAAIDGRSTVLRVLRRSGGPTLELPLKPQPTSPGDQAVAMYRSIFHWQPLLNGYASYYPRDFPELMTLAARLPDPHALQELRSKTGLRFVLVRLATDVSDDADEAAARIAWRELAARRDRSDLQLQAADDDLMLFRVN